MKLRPGKLWPKSIAPNYRKQVLRLYGEYYVRANFELWKRYSQLRYGGQRPISAHGEELIARSSDWRAFWVHKHGGSQKYVLQIWKDLASLSPDLCIDVGANYGEFSAVIHDSVERLLAIEANPLIYDCLRKTLPDSGVEVRNIAITDKEDRVTIYAKDDLSGLSSLSREVIDKKRSPAGTDDDIRAYDIAATSIDNLVVSEYGTLPSSAILKIDVEGFEDLVIKGAKKLMDNADWWRAIVEFSVPSIEKRGLDPAAYWQRITEYNGLLIDEDQPWDPNVIFELGSQLPDSYPNHANILIGDGRAINPGKS